MAILKVQIQPPGYTDIVHPETSADMVIMADSTTVEAKVTAHLVDDVNHIGENALDAHAVNPSCKVFSDVAQQIATNTDTSVSFNTVIFDTDAIFNASNSTRLTAKTAGKYLVTSSIHLANSTGSTLGVILKKNGVLDFANDARDMSAYNQFTISSIVELNVNDYVEVIVNHSAATTRMLYTFNERTPTLSMVKVG